MSEEEVENIRSTIVGQLQTIASESEQLYYERNVPIANIPNELLCQWFDDFYHPKEAYFQASFTVAELALLAEFDSFFRLNEPLLPSRPGSIQVWLDDPTWRGIMAKAEETLRRWREINPE